MKVLASVALAVCVGGMSSPARAQQTSPLAAPYAMKVGDIAASTLSELLKLRTDFRDPALITYEPTTETIDVEVFASPAYGSKTDQARAVLGKYWEFVQSAHIPYIERRLSVKLSAEHYRLMYYDARAQGGPQLVLQFVNGQYLIP